MMLNNKNDENCVAVPKLPCFVHEEILRHLFLFVAAPLFCFYLFFYEFNFLAVFFIGVLIWEILRTIYRVYLSNDEVEIFYGFFQKKKRGLKNSFILIDKFNALRDYQGKHYSYKAYLISKENTVIKEGNIISVGVFARSTTTIFNGVPQKPDKSAKFIKKPRGIPLSPRIFCPVNLREYVEAIQEQVLEPLHIVFSSEQIRKDYETGQYRAGLG